MDLDAATVSVRRSAGMVRNLARVPGYTKATPRAVNPAWSTSTTTRRPCCALTARTGLHGAAAHHPGLAGVGDLEGAHRNPEHVSRQFVRDAERCRQALGQNAVPVIRLHDSPAHARHIAARPGARPCRKPAARPRQRGGDDDDFTPTSCRAISGRPPTCSPV